MAPPAADAHETAREPGQRWPMPARRGGADVAYARGADLVVEWYDFGDDDHYEMVNLLVFDPAAQLVFARAMHAPADLTPDALASFIASRFEGYCAVQDFATAQAIPFSKEWSSWP